MLFKQRSLGQAQSVVEHVDKSIVDLERFENKWFDCGFHPCVDSLGIFAVHLVRPRDRVVFSDIEELCRVTRAGLVEGGQACSLISRRESIEKLDMLLEQ